MTAELSHGHNERKYVSFIYFALFGEHGGLVLYNEPVYFLLSFAQWYPDNKIGFHRELIPSEWTLHNFARYSFEYFLFLSPQKEWIIQSLQSR